MNADFEAKIRLARETFQAYPRPRPNLGKLRDDLAAFGIVVSVNNLRQWKARGHLGEDTPKLPTPTLVRTVEKKVAILKSKHDKLERDSFEKVGTEDLEYLVAKGHDTTLAIMNLIRSSIEPKTVGEFTVPGVLIEKAEDVAALARALSLVQKSMSDVVVNNKLMDDAKAEEAKKAPEAKPDIRDVFKLVVNERLEEKAAEAAARAAAALASKAKVHG